MTSIAPAPWLDLANSVFAKNYDRVPFGFSHNLQNLSLFENAALRSLCGIYAAHPLDYFVACSAPTAGTVFYSVPKTLLKPHEAFDHLTAGSHRDSPEAARTPS